MLEFRIIEINESPYTHTLTIYQRYLKKDATELTYDIIFDKKYVLFSVLCIDMINFNTKYNEGN